MSLFDKLLLFSGWTKRVEYTPGSGSIPLFPSLHLETCEETVWNIQATVELQTGHIGKGCDRDSYSDRSVRRLCGGSGFLPENMQPIRGNVRLYLFSLLLSSGAVRGEVDLLPPPSPAANWTSALPTLPSSDSSLVFSFNGSNHVAVVPDSVVSALSGDHFTLQLWMRRGGANIQAATTQTRGNHKDEETIVCSTVKNGVLNGLSLNLIYDIVGFIAFEGIFQSVHFWEEKTHVRPLSLGRVPALIVRAAGKIIAGKMFIASTTTIKVLLKDLAVPLFSTSSSDKQWQ